MRPFAVALPIVLLVGVVPLGAGADVPNPPAWTSTAPAGGWATDVAVSSDGTRVFATLPSGGIAGRPAVDLLRALDPLTGVTLWETVVATGPCCEAQLITVPGAVIVAVDGSTTLAAYADATGTPLWSAGLPFSPLKMVAAGGRILLSGSAHGSVSSVALDAGSGETTWTYRGPPMGRPTAPLAVTTDGSTVFMGMVPEYSGAQVVAIDGAAGAALWHAELESTEIRDLVLAPDGSRLFALGLQEFSTLSFASLEPATGAAQWSSTHSLPWYPQSTRGAASPDGWLAVGADALGSASTLRAFRIAGDTGQVVWTTSIPSPGWVPEVNEVVVAGDRIVMAGWTGSDALPGLREPELVATTLAFEASSGTIAWRADLDTPGPFDRAMALAASPDGTRVFVAEGATMPIVASHIVKPV